GADSRPGVDHRVRADPGTDVDVRRHQHDAAREKRAVARGCGWHDANAELVVAALERDLVVILEGADLAWLHLPRPEEIEDRGLNLAVHAPVVAVGFRDAHLAAIERGDRLFGRHRTSRRISAARSHSSCVGTSAMRT